LLCSYTPILMCLRSGVAGSLSEDVEATIEKSVLIFVVQPMTIYTSTVTVSPGETGSARSGAVMLQRYVSSGQM
jgi:hypothetical protein